MPDLADLMRPPLPAASASVHLRVELYLRTDLGCPLLVRDDKDDSRWAFPGVHVMHDQDVVDVETALYEATGVPELPSRVSVLTQRFMFRSDTRPRAQLTLVLEGPVLDERRLPILNLDGLGRWEVRPWHEWSKVLTPDNYQHLWNVETWWLNGDPQYVRMSDDEDEL